MSRFFKVEEAVDIRLLSNEDYQKRDRMRLLKWAKFVWQDMNLTTVKKTVRKKFEINKKTNTIDMPCSFLQLSSVSVIDKCGIEYPVFRNERLHDDIVDVSAAKDCACEYNCGNELCSLIKGYEAVVTTKEDKNPDGSDVSFECIDRKCIDNQGFFYEQLQYPKRIYEDGVWTETILFTEDRKLCKVEVDENGCCCDTEENVNAVCTACGIENVNSNLCCVGGTAMEPPNDSCNTWIYYCNRKLDWFATQCGGYPTCLKECNNIYNISELGDRLIFPANFGWDDVIIRWYDDTGTKDLEIPIVSIDTFVVGLMWWDNRFNDKKQKLAALYGSQYATLKFGLLKELNKYRVAELQMIMSPPRFIPSLIVGTSNQYEGGYRNIYGL